MEPTGQGRVERRVAAILAADVVGYSRLIEADEEGTLGRLKALRAEVVDPKIAEHRGRPLGRVRQRRRRAALRGRGTSGTGRRQCPNTAGPPHRVPYWHPPRRH